VIKIDVPSEALRDLKRALKSIPEKIPVAISRSINDASRSAVTLIDREVRARYRVSSSDVRSGISRTSSSPSKLEARVTTKGSRFPLFKFGIVARRSDLVIIEEVKGMRTPLQHYFIAIMDSGHVGIFKRTGEKKRMRSGHYKGKIREGIVELFGRARSQMMEAKTVEPKIEEKANAVFQSRMVHHAEFLLKQAAEELKKKEGKS
jgi:hypothetical protein